MRQHFGEGRIRPPLPVAVTNKLHLEKVPVALFQRNNPIYQSNSQISSFQ